jgi:hypothetical protein
MIALVIVLVSAFLAWNAIVHVTAVHIGRELVTGVCGRLHLPVRTGPEGAVGCTTTAGSYPRVRP